MFHCLFSSTWSVAAKLFTDLNGIQYLQVSRLCADWEEDGLCRFK